MLALAERGWGSKRIAKEVGCSRNTVRRYLKLGGWQDYAAPGRPKKLDQLSDWLASEFRHHGGNADVIRQELKRVHKIDVSLRTVERAVEQLRQEVKVQAIATAAFPGSFPWRRESAPRSRFHPRSRSLLALP